MKRREALRILLLAAGTFGAVPQAQGQSNAVPNRKKHLVKRARNDASRALLLLAASGAMVSFTQIPRASADALVWDTTTTASYFAPDWYDEHNGALTAPNVGDTLLINNGGTISYTAALGQSILLSAASVDGRSFDVNQGTFDILQGGVAGAGFGLELDASGSLSVENTSTVNIAGPLAVGQDSGSTASATFSGGTISIGTGSGTDQNLYAGNSGNGTVTQSASATVNTAFLAIAALAGSSGTYNMQGGTLNVTGGTFGVGVGGGDTGNSDTNGGNGIFKISGGTVNISNTLLIYPTANSAVNLSGGVLNVGEIETIGNSSRFNWTGGTLNLTNSGLTVGSGGLLGSSLTLSRSQNLEVSEYQEPLEINGALSLVNGATAEVNADSNGNIYVGYYNATNATASVNGSGSTLSSPVYLGVGYYSTGSATLSLGNGGQASGQVVDIGLGGPGNTTVTGNGSTLYGGVAVVVGIDSGSGMLSVSDGGQVNSPDIKRIMHQPSLF